MSKHFLLAGGILLASSLGFAACNTTEKSVTTSPSPVPSASPMTYQQSTLPSATPGQPGVKSDTSLQEPLPSSTDQKDLEKEIPNLKLEEESFK